MLMREPAMIAMASIAEGREWILDRFMAWMERDY